MDRCPDIISRTSPPDDIASLVEAFAGRSARVPRARFPVFPTGRAELIFHFADPFLVAEGATTSASPLAEAVLLGPRSRMYWQLAGPRIDWFLIQLTPLGCRRLLGLSFADTWHRDIPLIDLWGGRAGQLHERLRGALTFEGRRALAVTTIRAICGGVSGDSVSEAGRLARAGRIRSIATLGAWLDVGPRRLHQKFVAEYGIGPKTFLSLLRFGRQLEARHPLHARGHSDEPEYADDSHAIREFRRFSGLTPGEYIRQKGSGDRLIYTGQPVLPELTT